ADMLYRNCDSFISLEGYGPGQHLVKHHPETIEVRAGIQRSAASLFRTHIMRGTANLPDIGHAGYPDNAFSNTKIREYRRMISAKKNILRFDIPVDVAFYMGIIQRSGNIAGCPYRLGQAQAFQHPLMHRASRQVIHRDVVQVVVLTDIVNSHNMRM